MNKMTLFVGFCIGFILVSVIFLVLFNGVDTYPKSDYTLCIEASEDRTCEVNILKSMGYNDDVDCIMDYNNPICDFDRYNAEVDASNECIKPNIFDCMELLK